MNPTATNLLQQYLGKIQPNTQVFSTDVMSPDSFSKPFTEWFNNFSDAYLKPEFLRYQYNPYLQQSSSDLDSLNQKQGLSGAWRTEQGQSDMNTAAQSAMLKGEQLQQGFNDQNVNYLDQLKTNWINPLYNQNMQTFYQAPWANMNTGQTNTRSSQATQLPSMPATPVSKQAGNDMQMPTNLISQYLSKPQTSNSNIYSYLNSK